MSAAQQDDNTRTAFAVLIPVVILVVALAVGVGISKSLRKPAAAAAAAEPVAMVAVDEARVEVADGMVKFYFASGKAELASGAQEALAVLAQAAAAGKKLGVSGFHDATGDAAANEELAKQRALAVQAALLAAGVAEAAIELRKPELLVGSGDNAQARRVEVVVLP